jgi:hypothetical protein
VACNTDQLYNSGKRIKDLSPQFDSTLLQHNDFAEPPSKILRKRDLLPSARHCMVIQIMATTCPLIVKLLKYYSKIRKTVLMFTRSNMQKPELDFLVS